MNEKKNGRRWLIGLLLLGTLLAGCAGYRWARPGASDAQVEKDRRGCMEHARKNYSWTQSVFRAPTIRQKTNDMITKSRRIPPRERVIREMFTRCMEDKGYRLVEISRE